MTIAAPHVSEYAPVFAGYVARVAALQDPLRELTSQRAKVVERLAKLSDEQASFCYAPDKWSIKDLVGYLSDAERVFVEVFFGGPPEGGHYERTLRRGLI